MSNIYLLVELVSYMEILALVFFFLYCFCSGYINSRTHQEKLTVLFFPHILQDLLVLLKCIFIGVSWYFMAALICTFLMASHVEHFKRTFIYFHFIWNCDWERENTHYFFTLHVNSSLVLHTKRERSPSSLRILILVSYGVNIIYALAILSSGCKPDISRK